MTPDEETQMILRGINNQLSEIKKTLYGIFAIVALIGFPIIYKTFIAAYF